MVRSNVPRARRTLSVLALANVLVAGFGCNGAAASAEQEEPLGEQEQAVCSVVVPQAGDDFATTTAGQSVTISVLGNDTVGSKRLNPISVSSAPHGTTSIVNQHIVYVPQPGFVGVDSFYYQVLGCLHCAGASCVEPDTADALVTVTVNP